MNTEISNLLSELQVISDDTQKTFGNLTAEQINWKPGVDGWSVGQCFEHLIKTNSLFFPELDKIAAGSRRNSFLENYSPLSSFFGNLLVNSLKKDTRKFKAPTQKIVPPSEIDANIVKLFTAH
ncbi:MAG TPA: DinB family protein [Pyrinomonadaceae bacterium]|nr:DinB family protein [Pyrinomonadaceae bacterium]